MCSVSRLPGKNGYKKGRQKSKEKKMRENAGKFRRPLPASLLIGAREKQRKRERERKKPSKEAARKEKRKN